MRHGGWGKRVRDSPGWLPALAGLALLLQVPSTFGHGGYHERIEFLTKALEANPADPVQRFELANLHGQHGDLELALKNLDRVDAEAPGKFPTDLIRGDAFLVGREFAKAKEALSRQLASHPETARAWLLRARAERELGETEPSLADYREAMRRTATLEPDMVQESADALVAAGKREEAAAVLTAGIEKLGKIPSLVLRAIDLEIESKNFAAALQRVEQARRDAPRPEPWMARRAAVLAQAGRIDESRAAWKELLDHLESLPERERSSAGMSQLRDEARAALSSPVKQP
jgi:tetratricopeptide (TPR) repeat protein